MGWKLSDLVKLNIHVLLKPYSKGDAQKESSLSQEVGSQKQLRMEHTLLYGTSSIRANEYIHS